MVADSLNKSTLYYPLHPLFEKAFGYIRSIDLGTVAPGRYEVDGNDIFYMVSDSELRTAGEAPLEAHDNYIDIQILISGSEMFGWRDRAACEFPRGVMDSEKDILFFDDKPASYFTLRPCEFCIFMPGDAHAPLVGDLPGTVRKCVIKVKA